MLFLSYHAGFSHAHESVIFRKNNCFAKIFLTLMRSERLAVKYFRPHISFSFTFICSLLWNLYDGASQIP